MKEKNAYFTVEAALVLPIVIGALLFVIYTLLFQYDRCLLEQDLGAIALWGSLAKASDTAELEQMAQARIASLYRDKYVAWKITKLEVALDKNRFSVEGAGRLTFPAAGWKFWNGGDVWETGANYRCSRISPVSFIRLCHKFERQGR